MAKKTARKKAAAKKVAPKPAAPAAPLTVEELLARQNDLLEIVALSTARMMMLADNENRLAGDARAVPDPHGLRSSVEKLLTRSAMASTLIRD